MYRTGAISWFSYAVLLFIPARRTRGSAPHIQSCSVSVRAAAAAIVRPSLGDVAGSCGKRGRGRVSKSGRGSCAPARDNRVLVAFEIWGLSRIISKRSP